MTDCRHGMSNQNAAVRPDGGLRIAEKLAAAFVGLLLAGCAALPQPEIDTPSASEPADFPHGFYQQADADQVYQVATASLVLKTYRAGWLKSLAHAHVMTTSSLTGYIYVDPEGMDSRADLYFRPYDLVLDDPASRASAGPEFASERSEADIAATRLRMLGPRQLDSNGHPFVRIRVLPGAGDDQVRLAITLRDQVAEKTVPLSWQLSDGELTVLSEFQLTHKELGLRPYSAFAGALAVAETVDVSLSLTAQRLDLRGSR